MDKILKKLKGGDRRSIGRSEEVVKDVLNEPNLFAEIFNGMLHNDPIVRMRAADAIEKISSKHPEYIQPYKHKLINQVAKIEQQEVRWHVALMFSRLKITKKEKSNIVNILMGYLKDKSKIVKTFSMQALSDIAEKDNELKPQIINLIKDLVKTGSPAMQSRGKKLLKQLNKA